jgi:hypothetical protein
MCGGSWACAGTKSKWTFEKPPMSSSDMTLHSSWESGWSKVMRGKGLSGRLIASALIAVLRPCQLLDWQGRHGMRGGGPMLDNLESSCRLRFQKPGGASKRLVHCMLRCVVVVWDGKKDGCTDDDSRSDKLQKTRVVGHT